MDMEARGHSEHPEALRLWLRMLTCTQLVEKQVRTQLREQFDTTLPRFDLMAQLERSPEGLKMNELSRRMMVTGGNVTGITDQLVTEGLVERVDVEGDRRAYRVRLTTRGRKLFDEGDTPYHLAVTATETFPTGVIRAIYTPTDAPGAVGYDDVKGQVPDAG